MIVDCKTQNCELIETLWNVNLKNFPYLQSWLLELIETLWNVNRLYSLSPSRYMIELIETLWNVNDGSVGPGLYVHRN